MDANLEGADLSFARLTLSDLGNARLRNADLQGADLRGAELINADLEHATLMGARMSGADLSRANLRHVRFARGQVITGTFFGADLRDTDLRLARLRDALVSPATRLPAGIPHPALACTGDDVVHTNSLLHIASWMPCANALRTLATDLGVRVHHGAKDAWLRDLYFKSVSGDLVVTYRQPDADVAQSRYVRGSDFMKEHRYSNGIFEVKAKLFGKKDGVQLTGLPEHGTRFLEGGNMFITADRTCIMGNDSLLYGDDEEAGIDVPGEVDMQRAAKSFPELAQSRPQLASSLWHQRAVARQEVRNILGVEKLVIVPQGVLFHLDMQLAYLGGRDFLVHSYLETTKYLQKNKERIRAELGTRRYRELVASSIALTYQYEESVVDVLVRKLTKHQYNAVRCCANLFTIADGQPDFFHSCFVNGIPVECNGTRYFLTLNAPRVPTHREHFRNVCKTLGVEVRFVDLDDGSDPSLLVTQTRGGLRCMTNKDLYGVLDREPDAEDHDEGADARPSAPRAQAPRQEDPGVRSNSPPFGNRA